MSDPVTVIREDDRPVVPFPGGPPYRPLIGDDNGANIPIRTGIQTSEPGYATREHSHPYVEVLTVLEGRGEAWLDGEPDPRRPRPRLPRPRRRSARYLRHPHLRQAHRQLQRPGCRLILKPRGGN